MDIIISKDEIKEYEKLNIITEITLIKEKITLFETKYGCPLEVFKKRMEEHEEIFEEWDDYIEWKANFDILGDLEEKLIKTENAKKIKII